MIKNASNANKKGFTLIELLVVIGILAVLLAITIIAINPARQFANANNTARRSAATQILNAIGQYIAENSGQLPGEVSALTAGAATTFNSTNFPNLCGQLVPTYIPALPADPSLNDANGVETADCTAGTPNWNTGYTISRDANNRITVAAPSAENGVTISVTR